MPAVISPNLGLVLNRPPIDIPKGGLHDGINFRCRNGTLESLNLGWSEFSDQWVLDGAVRLITRYRPREGAERLIFGSTRDLYVYNTDTDTIRFITPVYVTGTAAASGTTVTGTGTAWNTDTNAEVGDMISFGSATEYDPEATWYEIEAVGSDTSLTLTESAGTVANGPYTIRKRFTNAAFMVWSTDTFINDGSSGDDLWFATNGLDWVVTWNGTDDTAILHPELGFICQSLKTYSNMMIYGNITQGGDNLMSSIINSDVGLPLNAGATSTGLSEQFTVHSGTDEILTMETLGDYLIIYSERTIVAAQFIGDPLIFQFRVAIAGTGLISARAIADYGDYHEFIGNDAGYVFDGVTMKEVNNHVWRSILRQADPARRLQVYSHFDEENGDLIWAVPGNLDANVGQIGEPGEVAWVEHYLEQPSNPNFPFTPFSKRTFSFTAVGSFRQTGALTWDDIDDAWENINVAWDDQFLQAAFPIVLGGDENGQIWIINQTQAAGGQPLPSYVQTARMALGSGRERDLLTRVYPFAKQLPYTLEVTLYTSDHVSGELTNKGTETFDMNLIQGRHFVSFFRRGRVVEFRFGSSIGEPWVLEGWDYDKVTGGMR